MIRTQIQLTEEQARRLRAIAHEEGISMAEVIRRCLDQQLSETGPDRARLYERAARLIGRFEDQQGATDLSTSHDRYLDEIYS